MNIRKAIKEQMVIMPIGPAIWPLAAISRLCYEIEKELLKIEKKTQSDAIRKSLKTIYEKMGMIGN